MDEMYIAQKIKSIREYLGFSQPELGSVIGATKQCICSWEKGKSMPDIITFFKILNVSGLTATELFKDIDSSKEENKIILSNDEQRLIAKLRTFPLEKRKALNSLLDINPTK